MESFQKICQQTHLFIRSVNDHQRPIKRWLGHEFYRESFWLPKKFSSLKWLWEFFIAQKVISSQEIKRVFDCPKKVLSPQMIKRVFHWIQSSYPLKYKASYLHNSLVKHLWHSIMNWALHCNICLFQERSFLLPLLVIKGLRDWESLVVWHLNTKEGMSLCVSEVVKDLRDSGTPKRVFWGLDVGNFAEPV